MSLPGALFLVRPDRTTWGFHGIITRSTTTVSSQTANPYEPFRNAPELALYHNLRRKRAERRVRAATEVDEEET